MENQAFHVYKAFFVNRLDKDGITPYLSYRDFPGMETEESSFLGRDQNEIRFFRYRKDVTEGTILFLPGVGPGHTAYMSEISFLADIGYEVLTLDYTGCGASSGKSRVSIHQPLRDVLDLLDHLHLSGIPVMGHSLGAYTGLSLLNLRPDLKKAVLMSGFYDFDHFIPAVFQGDLCEIGPYEERHSPEYRNLDNYAYLESTDAEILFIASEDDPMVPFALGTGYVRDRFSSHGSFSFLVNDRRGHNPDYTIDAVNYMHSVFGEYNALVKAGKLSSDREKKDYMKDKSARKMTALDEEVKKKITAFLQ